MARAAEFPVSVQVTTSVRVNVRLGAPNTSAPVVRKIDAGSPLAVLAVAAGEEVQGNALWLRIDPSSYIWAGASNLASAPSVPASATTAPLDRTPWVVDLYHDDRVISFADAKAAGLLGVIHKATTGGTGVDDAYARRRTAATAAGLLWGAYHWGTAAPIKAQVDNFLAVAQPDENTLVAVDFEPTAGNQMTLQGLKDFCEALAAKLGRKPVIYGGSLLKDSLGADIDAFLGGHRLWLAQYGPAPTVQRSWSSYWLWQYTDGKDGPGCRTVPGIPGNAADLSAQWAS